MKKLIFILLVLSSCHSQKKAQRLPYCMMGRDIMNYVDSNGRFNLSSPPSGETIWVKSSIVMFDAGFRIGMIQVKALDNATYSTTLSGKEGKFYDRIWVHSKKVTQYTSYVLEENFWGSTIVDTVKEIRNVTVFSN